MQSETVTGKEFLRQYLDCEKGILFRQRKIRQLKEQAEGLSQTLRERVQSSGSLQRQAEVIDIYLDMQEELACQVRRFREVQSRVLGAIEKLSDSRERQLLERYYIEGLTLEETALDMRYSYMQVCRIHGRALAHLDEMGEGS